MNTRSSSFIHRRVPKAVVFAPPAEPVPGAVILDNHALGIVEQIAANARSLSRLRDPQYSGATRDATFEENSIRNTLARLRDELATYVVAHALGMDGLRAVEGGNWVVEFTDRAPVETRPSKDPASFGYRFQLPIAFPFSTQVIAETRDAMRERLALATQL